MTVTVNSKAGLALVSHWVKRDRLYGLWKRYMTDDEIVAVRFWRFKEAQEIGDPKLIAMARNWDGPRITK